VPHRLAAVKSSPGRDSLLIQRRFAKPALVLLAAGVLALVVSACAYFKPNSLALSQPGGIGSVRVHFVLCTEPSPECEPNEENEDVQYVLGIAAPPGSVPPATVTAVPLKGGSPITFTRNEEVTTEMTAASGRIQQFLAEEGAPPEVTAVAGGQWPPSGLQGYGYLSDPVLETEGTEREWSVDADFGLPTASDGGPFSGPFATGLAFGFRIISPSQSASRPVRCWRVEAEPQENEAFCGGTVLQGQIGTSDLRIAPPKTTSVFVGGRVPVKFGLNFASTTAPPSFALSAKTSVKGAKTTLATGSSFVPGPLDPTTHRAPTATTEVMVSVPAGAKPGTYEVTLTGAAPQGGTASAVAKLKVTKPKLKFGGVKLNKAKGTATLKVKVPSGGRLSVAGKGIAKVKKSTKKAKALKLTIKPTGNAKSLLEQTGKAKVKAKVTFKPSSGSQVSKTKTITLKLS
jgi:hypothetical protein